MEIDVKMLSRGKEEENGRRRRKRKKKMKSCFSPLWKKRIGFVSNRFLIKVDSVVARLEEKISRNNVVFNPLLKNIISIMQNGGAYIVQDRNDLSL